MSPLGTSHSYHPDSHTHGLADGCPRCQEHAKHPERSLDRENIRRLLRGDVHTITDGIAAARLAESLACGRFLQAILDDGFEQEARIEALNRAEEDRSPLCAACGESVTDAATDGAVGFIHVGEDWYHVAHAPQAYPPGTRPDPDEDVEAWHEAEGAAAEAEADRLTSDPDYMGCGR